MTTYRLGIDQDTWNEEKLRLTRPTSITLSLAPSGLGAVHVDTTNVQVPVRLDIHHVDVGQGESTLLVVMAETVCICSVLIDCGLALEGGGLLVRLLHRLGLEYLDAVIISHFDLDHCEGLVRVLRQFEAFKEDGKPSLPVDTGEEWKPLVVQKVFLRDWPTKAKSTRATKAIASILDFYARKAVVLVNKNDEITLDCDADQGLFKMTCLSVNDADPQSSDVENAASIAWLVELGKHTYYTAGDLPSEDMGADKEDALGPIIKAKWGALTAIKCGHHGAETSTSSAFLGEVAPWLAFISAGKQDGFNHPRTKTLVSLYNQPSVGLVFMTNCFYTRPWVNDGYLGVTYDEIQRLVTDSLSELRRLVRSLPEPPDRAKTVKPSDATSLAKLLRLLGKLEAHVLKLETIIADLAGTTIASDTALPALAKIAPESADFDALVANNNNDTQQAVAPLLRGYEVMARGGRSFIQSKINFKVSVKPIQESLHEATSLARDLADGHAALAKTRTEPFHVFVAGGEQFMGNIVLRFFVADAAKDNRVAFAGLHGNGGWQWLSLRSGDIDPSTIQRPTDDYLSHVDVATLGPLLTPGSPYRDSSSKSTKSYKSRTLERVEKRKLDGVNLTDRSVLIRDWEDTQDNRATKKKKVTVEPTTIKSDK